MNRRTFTRRAGIGVAAAIANLPLPSPHRSEQTAFAADASKPQRPLMKVGTQHGSSDEVLALLSAFGVTNICSDLPSARFDENWSVAGLRNLKARVESYGIKLDMIPLPLSSVTLDKSENPNILRGKSPERDREIDNICKMIQNAAQAGIPAVKYNMSVLGVVRSDPVQGRGRSSYSTFDYEKALQKPPQNDFPPVNCRSILGANHLLPRARRAGGRGVQGANRLPSQRPGHAGRQRIPRRAYGVRQRRRPQAICRDQAEQISRT